MPEPPASSVSSITILIVEHPDVSKFLHHCLENYSAFTVIEAATDGKTEIRDKMTPHLRSPACSDSAALLAMRGR